MSNIILNLLNKEEWWRCSHRNLQPSLTCYCPFSQIIKPKLKIGKALWNFPENTTEKSNCPFHLALLSRSFVFSASLDWSNPTQSLFLLISIKLLCPSLFPPSLHSCRTTPTYHSFSPSQPHSLFSGTLPHFFNKIYHSEFLNSKLWTNKLNTSAICHY